MRLQQKAFFILIVISSGLVLATTLLVHHSFRYGLQDFVNERQQRHLIALVRVVETENLFQQLAEEPSLLRKLWRRSQASSPKHKNGPRKPPLLVLDQNKNLLAGHAKNKDYIYAEIKKDGGRVGYLALPVIHQLYEARDINFLKQQQQNLWLLALLVICLSALLSKLIAPHIVKPLIEISKASKQLKQQKFSYRINSHRKDEIGELADNMDVLARHLESTDTQRRRWLASTSHELRTPLAVLKAEIEAMLDGIREPNEKRLKSLLEEVSHLEKLTIDLQQLNQNTLSYELAPLDISELLHGLEEKFTSVLRDKSIGVEMKLCNKAYLYADKNRVQQLFENLLQNSARYTDGSGQLSIELSVENHQITLVWQDSSPGVSDENLNHIFEYLYRADESRNKETGGFGLGLSIVQDIVSAHGGEIVAEHSKLGGLKLTMYFKELA